MENVMENLGAAEEDTLKGKYLTFFLGKECYGIEIRYVTEIVGIQAVTNMPELPYYVRGIINLRGKIIPVMDIRLRFGKEPREYTERTCIIVIDIRNTPVGLIIDTVSEVLPIGDENIVPPPQVNKAANKYVKSIGKNGSDVTLILDCEKLLNGDELDALTA